MEDPWVGLLANLGLISIAMSIWVHALDWVEDRPETVRLGFVSFLGGLTVVILLLTPIQMQPGIFFDLRTVPIATTSFFFGPVTGIITATVAALCRVAIGGVGAPPAIIGIAVITVVGISGHFLLRGREPGRRAIVAFAAATALASLTGFFFLPPALRAETLPLVAVPALILVFIGQLGTGLGIAAEWRRRDAAATNLLFRSIIDALPEPLNAKDRSGRFLAANPATAKLMQASSVAALIGRTDADFYPPDVAAVFRDDEERVLATGKPMVIEQQVARRDGFSGWLSTLKAPLRGVAAE